MAGCEFMDAMIITKLAGTDAELEGIRQLQERNLRKHLSEAEAMEQGFLIAEYSVDFLRTMNAHRPSAIAVDGDRVVGYALAATRAASAAHPFLNDLFAQIDQLQYRQESLRDVHYVVVGQLCVDKDYRGRGLVGQLYDQFRTSLQPHFRYAITDIAQANRRSLQAHRRIGFQVIHSIDYGGLGWEVVLWDWTVCRGNGGSPGRDEGGAEQEIPAGLRLPESAK